MSAVSHDNPIDYVFDYYTNREFIDSRFLIHARDHDVKVGLNLSGLVASLNGPTHAAVNAFSLAIGAADMELRIQRGKTSLKDIMLLDFILECRMHFPVFKSIFRDHPEIMLEFEAHGMYEINHITTGEAELIIHNVAKACLAHEADITHAVAQIFYDFDTNYKIAHNIQIEAKGTYKEDKVLIAAARALLTKQLIYNLGFIIKEFNNNRVGALALFDFILLYVHHNTPHQYIVVKAQPNAVTNVPDAVVSDGKIISAKDFSDEPVIMSIELAKTTKPGLKQKRIPKHNGTSAKAEDIRNNEGHFLNIYNASDIEVVVQIDIHDA